ncbi:PLP-dependent aminotransferase family protein [Streptomyces sp. A7024]|uniref:PLP-dependent aminotransferase family protein n=2 Tax=Streptomyces coryli TaxID=1128680 RepID=A0A6G4U331_9ACTN|nr:PLP-dependent aminotransferase family protein [Streptomyces coryli]
MDHLVGALGLWSTGRGPLYLLLARRIRELIDEGRLRPGALLPPERALAAALAVGRTTVVGAYGTLRAEGRIVRRQGSGTRVAEAALVPGDVAETDNPIFLHLLQPPAGVILLSCAAPDGPPPELRAAYARMELPARGLGYHPAGLDGLRAAVAARYAARGVPTDPGQILVTTGGQQALSLLTRLLVGPGDRVLVEAPTYPGTLDLLREAGAVLRPVAVGPDGVDPEAAIRTLSEERPALACLGSVYQNPTGSVLPPLVGRRIAAAAARAGVPLIDDEVPAELSFSGEAPPTVAGYVDDGAVISVGSLSKVVWGGLRIGWVRAPAAMVTRLARLKAVHDLGTDVPAQLVATDLLSGLDALLARRRRELRHGHDHLRELLASRLPEWDCPPVQGGQTVWVRLPYGDGVAFAQLALRHGVGVLPGVCLDAAGGSRPYLRLHFVTSDAELTEAVDRLAAAWAAYDGRGALEGTGAALGGITV